MVDIEFRRVRVYFSVGNRAKWGLEGLELRNTVSGEKRHRFSHHKFFFFNSADIPCDVPKTGVSR